jgi:hypothetical protein
LNLIISQRRYEAMRQTVNIFCAAVITAALLAGATALAGTLEPAGPPAPTMKTLDQITPTWSQMIPGDQRFDLVLNNQEAVLDKETGLVWARTPFGIANWAGTGILCDWSNAVSVCSNTTIGGRSGWRLPTVEELGSLIDLSNPNAPKLPVGHPFQNVDTSTLFAGSSTPYWTASTRVLKNCGPTSNGGMCDPPYSLDTDNVWAISMNNGYIGARSKTTDLDCNVWCVRGAQQHQW